MPWADAVAKLFFPDRCQGCGRFGPLLCGACRVRLPAVGGEDRCQHCRGRWKELTNCPRCFSWLALDQTVVACEMSGVARRMVHGLKYRGISDLARVMADLILAEAAEIPDAALAVPLHPGRERRRGFNQSTLLLDALGWGALRSGTLSRVKNTASQVGMRELERRRNVAGAFEYRGADLGGLAVAVVDDVITTGATVTECARVLKEHGARSVIAVAFARAHYEPGTVAPIFD